MSAETSVQESFVRRIRKLRNAQQSLRLRLLSRETARLPVQPGCRLVHPWRIELKNFSTKETRLDERRFDEAETAYKGVFELRPRDARAAYGLGNVYNDQQRWDDAEKAYRDAVEWAPKNVDALVALSVTLVQPRAGGDNAKRFADAELFARRAVQLEPKNAVGWDRLGVALQSRGLFNNETEHAYRRAVELDPNFAVAYAHLGRVLKRNGRGEEAAPLYSRATELAKDPATLNLIASCCRPNNSGTRRSQY